jgi:hypothetical protein
VQIPTQKHKEYEKQGNMSPPKFSNSTVTKTNYSEVDEISYKELKKTIIRMIS